MREITDISLQQVNPSTLALNAVVELIDFSSNGFHPEGPDSHVTVRCWYAWGTNMLQYVTFHLYGYDLSPQRPFVSFIVQAWTHWSRHSFSTRKFLPLHTVSYIVHDDGVVHNFAHVIHR